LPKRFGDCWPTDDLARRREASGRVYHFIARRAASDPGLPERGWMELRHDERFGIFSGYAPEGAHRPPAQPGHDDLAVAAALIYAEKREATRK